MVSPDVVVGEAVSTTGRFGDFDAEEQERAASGSVKVDAFKLLLQGAMDKTFLPEKWNANNAKLSLKNNIIDWLAKNKLGWQAALAKYVGLMFVSHLDITYVHAGRASSWHDVWATSVWILGAVYKRGSTAMWTCFQFWLVHDF